MKKLITLLLCVTMVMSMLVVPAGATGNYNEQTGAIAVTEYPNGGSFDTLVSNATDRSTLYSYEGGIAGKAADDYSQVIRLSGDTSSTTDFDISTAGTSANAFINWYGGKSGTFIHDGRAFEFDAYVDGDVKLMIQTTNTNVTYDITESACQGEWKHYTLWLDASGSYVYENGVLVAQYTTRKNVYRIRLVIWLTANKVDFDGVVAIDNMKITTGLASCPEYTEASVSSTNDAVKLYDNMINVPADMTVEALKGSLTSDIALGYNVCTSDLSPKADDAIVNVGDIIVAYDSTYANNTNMKYIDVVDIDTINEAIEAANLIKYVDFENSETLNTANNTGSTATHLGGLYGKSADDDAYVLQAGTAASPRVNLNGYEPFTTPANWNTAAFEPATATLEFSFAVAPGMYDDFQIYGMPKYKVKDSVDDNTRYELTTQFFQVTDGVELTANTMGYKFDYPAGQWVRIAITIDGANETYDMYVNGVLARNDAPVGMATSTTKWTGAGTLVTDWTGDNTDNWEFVGLSEIRVQGYRTSGQVSDIAIDDIKAYYGDYGSTDCVTVNGYDNFDPNGTIVLDEGDSLTVAELTAAVGDADVAVYTDSTYTAAFTGETLDANAVAIITDGFVKRYFKADNIRMNAEDSIKLYDADGELAAITAGASIYAKATPDYVGHKPTLIMAIYNDDELETVKIAVGNSGKAIQTEAYTVADDADVANLSVKAMLWDGFENIKPYVEAIAVPAN